jgi:D-alanyl-D-alanine-carboxypeptidase/D-alanyl-D-alanine-endopeptidase
LLCGCAHSTVTHAVGPDEQQGLKLLEESTKAASAGILTDAEVATILNDNIGRGGQADGMVVGIIDEHGPRIISAGTVGDGSARPVDGDTVFEIGSITKVFTALLLEDMLERGQMKFDDPVQKYLPDSVKMPTHDGKPITLFNLATHTSGLPRDWADLGGPTDTVGHLYAALSRFKLPRDPGDDADHR